MFNNARHFISSAPIKPLEPIIKNFMSLIEYNVKLNKKSLNEKYEDIEILRFLDNHLPVKMVKANGSKIAIDTLEDFNKAKRIIEKL
jgi:CMP-2-keto-3-deoxyoctulosonic acid synthetase